MGEMSIKEIEGLVERLSCIAVAVDNPASMIGISYDRNALPADAIRAARALRQLLDAQKWRPIDSRSMNGGAYLCKCHWRDQSGHIEEYIVLKWDAASGCWLDWDDNHIKNDVPVAYCEIPLPSPPQEKENGDA